MLKEMKMPSKGMPPKMSSEEEAPEALLEIEMGGEEEGEEEGMGMEMLAKVPDEELLAEIKKRGLSLESGAESEAAPMSKPMPPKA